MESSEDLITAHMSEATSTELINAIDVDVFNIVENEAKELQFNISDSMILMDLDPSVILEYEKPSSSGPVEMEKNHFGSSDNNVKPSNSPLEDENPEVNLNLLSAVVIEHASPIPLLAKEDLALNDFKEKLKCDRVKALNRREKLNLEKKEKKRERDREYQRKRYQKLKELKKQSLHQLQIELIKPTEIDDTRNSLDNQLQKSPIGSTQSFITKDNDIIYNPSKCNLNKTPKKESSSQTKQFRTRVLYHQNPTLPKLNSSNTIHNESPVSNENNNLMEQCSSETNNLEFATDNLNKKPGYRPCPSKHKKKIGIEEKRLKNREKLRKWRAERSIEKKNEMKAKDKKYRAEKRKAEKENLSEISSKERKRLAKLNRLRSKRYRDKNKKEKVSELQTAEESVDVSPNALNEKIETTPKNDRNFNDTSNKSSNQKNERKKPKHLTEVYKKQLKIAIQRANRYKKRLQRTLQNSNSPSPSKKIRKLAGGKKVPTPVKRRLRYLEVLEDGLEKKKNEIKSKGNVQELTEFNEAVSSPKLKKLRLISEAKTLVTYKGYKNVLQGKKRKVSSRKISSNTAFLIKKFYCQDNISKMMPGKRDFKRDKTKKIKHQTRLLLGTIKEVHQKYNKEHPTNKVSKETFRRLKPVWVKFPKLSDRNTCACVLCCNVELMYQKASQINLVSKSLKELTNSLVCNTGSKFCMFNRCQRCKNNLVIKVNPEDNNTMVSYYQWVNTTKTLLNNKTIKVVAKVEQMCSKTEFVQKFCSKLNLYKGHTFKIGYQFEELKRVKETLRDNEALIHCDFSENYVCKGYIEPQSLHFGGSKSQLSLHTVLIYTKGSKKSVCTVSSDTTHKSHAVWAHLQPIFNLLPEGIDTLHLQTDGPSSQYKNRFNLYFVTKVATYLPNLKFLTWNFSVSGHGKGPADGVGGNVKRAADLRVKTGHDISDVPSFIKEVTQTCQKVEIIEVSSGSIESEKKRLPMDVAPVPNISKIQQVTWTKSQEDVLFLRELSCFSCPYDQVCEHHSLNKGKHKMHNDINLSSNLGQSLKKNQRPRKTSSEQKFKIQPKTVDVGTWVTVIFDNTWFPGVVEKKDDDVLKITFMHRTGSKFYWPSPADQQTVKEDTILTIMDEAPMPVSNRHYMCSSLKEIQKIFEDVMSS